MAAMRRTCAVSVANCVRDGTGCLHHCTLGPVKSGSALRRGLSVWLELAESVDTLSAYPLALEQGVAITPGPLFSVSGRFRNCLRIRFVHPWDTRRVEALSRLPGLLLEG